MEELIRLQKVIAERGFCSRRKAETLILDGKVKVNGEIITELGTKILDTAEIEIEGYDINNIKESKKTFVFNKPLGVVSTSHDDRNRPTIVDFFEKEGLRLYSVGRLDFNTSGCLLVTNDGELSQLVTHPSSHMNKTYIVTVFGFISDSALQNLQKGVMLQDGMTEKAKVLLGKRTKEVSIFKIIIHEGRNRQVRRMCEAVGYKVKSLYRESVGPITCYGLSRGQYRQLSEEEVNEIKEICKNNQKTNIIPEYKQK